MKKKNYWAQGASAIAETSVFKFEKQYIQSQVYFEGIKK